MAPEPSTALTRYSSTEVSVPELYVADYSNGCVQVYEADGKWVRVFGEDFLTGRALDLSNNLRNRNWLTWSDACTRA